MTLNNDMYVNSGVHANTGMDFQKYCAIYIFLENYKKLNTQKYFIILEHLEDIVFGFLDDQNDLVKVETYQAKKSSNKWTIGESSLNIIQKITKTAQSIVDDPHPKSSVFSQENFFATNNVIELSYKIDKKTHTQIVNESNDVYKYFHLCDELKQKICNGHKFVSFSEENINNLDTLHFKYIDLAKKSSSQKQQLQGMFENVFGKSINDYKAALDTFIYKLKQIETTFNQGNLALLSDSSKRLECEDINVFLSILTTKNKAYDFWRDRCDELCNALNVTIFDRSAFELNYLISFDLFKDKKESEHQKILNFVKGDVSVLKTYTSDALCIKALVDSFRVKKTTVLSDIQFKSAIAAAYIEVIELL